MKMLKNEKTREKIFNIFIILIVVALYVTTFLFIYSNFRERKRKEISNSIIKKVDKKIDENKDENVPQLEFNTKYNGINYTVLGKISIKKINIYAPILKENTKKAFDASVVKVAGPDLNNKGNVVIGGHNFMRGNFFIKINRLVKNDIITITDLTGKSVKYYVYDYFTTTIDDASYLSKPDNEDEMRITLVTCTKGGKQRYVVKARAK